MDSIPWDRIASKWPLQVVEKAKRKVDEVEEEKRYHELGPEMPRWAQRFHCGRA